MTVACPRNCLAGLKKTARNISHYIRLSDRDYERAQPQRDRLRVFVSAEEQTVKFGSARSCQRHCLPPVRCRNHNLNLHSLKNRTFSSVMANCFTDFLTPPLRLKWFIFTDIFWFSWSPAHCVRYVTSHHVHVAEWVLLDPPIKIHWIEQDISKVRTCLGTEDYGHFNPLNTELNPICQ